MAPLFSDTHRIYAIIPSNRLSFFAVVLIPTIRRKCGVENERVDTEDDDNEAERSDAEDDEADMERQALTWRD